MSIYVLVAREQQRVNCIKWMLDLICISGTLLGSLNIKFFVVTVHLVTEGKKSRSQ
jgi:hypothetical protein